VAGAPASPNSRGHCKELPDPAGGLALSHASSANTAKGKLGMKARKTDMLVMLLSTDWFKPYWFALGIGLGEKQKGIVQQGCREIVNQILSGAKEYWLANFSTERLEQTQNKLWGLLRESGADESSTRRIAALIGEGKSSTIENGTAWILVSITEQLFNNVLPTDQVLNPAVKEVLAGAWSMWNNFDFPKINFKESCLASTSEWDKYIRSLTPGLPTSVSDFLDDIESQTKSQLLLTAINVQLTSTQRRELMTWYSRVGRSLSGEELKLPPELQ
jgi:hypothetical protein